MDLIIFNDGVYQLIPVTKEILNGIVLTSEVSCIDLCNILREKLSGYANTLNLHIMNDGSGNSFLHFFYLFKRLLLHNSAKLFMRLYFL